MTINHFFSLLATTIAVSLAAGAQSHASPFQYTYNWSASPIAIAAGTGGVTLTDEPAISTSQPTDTAATNITVFSAASASKPDVIPFPVGGSNYSLAITFGGGFPGDPASTITFTGILQGQLTHDSSNLTNSITGVTDETGVHIGQTYGITTIDGVQYDVSYNGFAAPGPEAQHNQGAISFHIDFLSEVSGGPTAPEPSSMVLGCLGLTFLGGVVYRIHRRKADLLTVAA